MSERARARGVRAARVDVALDRGVFMISVAAELAEMHPQTLRMYEARGLIEPSRSPKGTRLYSQDDVERLRRIQQMTAELGLNLAGVERVLALELELDAAHERLARLEREAEQARAEMAAEIERLRRSFRADIVPYSRASTAMVRSADARSPFARRTKRPS
jgi:MerR family transcriptional regulator/heat shock protein HspR